MIWLSVIGAAMAADVVINEAMVNPYGSDYGREWVELYNASDEPASLTGWTLQWALSSTTSYEHELASVAIEPGGFYVISGELVGGGDELAELTFGNASTNADIIQIVNGGGSVVDSLIYGASNSDGWLDDSGVEADSLAPKPSEGQSLARLIDGVDTDACGDDFARFEDPSIGTTNADGAVYTDEPEDVPDEDFERSSCPGADAIKINEVMVNPSGPDTDGEWVELYNAGSSTVSLAGWSIVGGPSDFGLQHEFTGAIDLDPGQHLLVGGAAVPASDVLADGLSLGNAGTNGDAVRLLGCDDLTADTLIYGGNNSDGWLDDNGYTTDSLAPKPSEGSSLARISDGYDTDESREDWIATTEPTPGYSNPYTEPIECQPGWKQIKINEFLVNPDGDDGGAEWIELYNPHDATLSLDGWALRWGTSSYSNSLIFASGTDLGAGDYLLVGGEFVEGADIVGDLSLGNAGSNSDALQLVDCDEVVQDTVVYGGPNDDLWADDAEEIASSLPSSPGDGQSLARVNDGEDTDRSGEDFVLTDDPSPGAANPETVPVVCVSGEFDIKINELLPNPTGSDDGQEFVELYNNSSEDISLDGWGLSAHTSKWPGIAQMSFPGGTTIPAGGFYVVGGEAVDEADLVMTDDNDISLGNTSKNPDGVRLLDCNGVVQDTVLYGDAGEPIENFELLDDLDGVSMAGMPREGLSVGRIADGVDTDVSEDDFAANMPPTPGEANTEAGAGGGGGDSPGGGCGCGKGGPGGGDAPAGEASAVAGVVATLAIFVAMRRRESGPMENL